jgi:hypothetical protein
LPNPPVHGPDLAIRAEQMHKLFNLRSLTGKGIKFTEGSGNIT